MKIERILSYQACQSANLCSGSPFCQDAGQLTTVDKYDRQLSAKEMLLKQGQNLTHIYVLRQGLIKAFQVDDNGGLTIVNFYYPGDVIGLDCMYSDNTSYYAQSVTNCIVSRYEKSNIINNVDTFNALSKQIMERKNLLRVLTKMSAKEKVSWFLYQHSIRLCTFGHCKKHFKLGFRRADVATHLGMSVESISRIITSLKEQNIISIKESIFTINEPEKLLAELHSPCFLIPDKECPFKENEMR